jgi:hypothetical protein
LLPKKRIHAIVRCVYSNRSCYWLPLLVFAVSSNFLEPLIRNTATQNTRLRDFFQRSRTKETHMKTAPSPNSFARFYTILVGIFAAAVLAVPSYSVVSGSLAANMRPEAPANSPSAPVADNNSTVKFSSLLLSSIAPVPLAETIEIYASDCSTPKTTFSLGELVCAKTDGVSLSPADNYYVNWTGPSGTTNDGTITKNPQFFIFALPTTTADAGLWKPNIGRVSPAESSIIGNPPNFTVSDGVSIATFASDCATPKTSYSLGDTVCARVAGAPVDANRVMRRLQLVDPAGFVRDSVNISTPLQQHNFTLPTIPTPGQFGSSFIDNRGTWRVNLVDTLSADVTDSDVITVRDPAGAVCDLETSKNYTGTSTGTAGSTLEAVVWVYNYGPDAAQGVSVVDQTPSNTTFQSLTQTHGPAFNCTTPSVGGVGASTCTGSSLAVGQAAGFVITYEVSTSSGNTITTSIATASSTTADRISTDNNSTVDATISNPTPPSCTLTCPSNITITAAQGQNGATVNFNQPDTAGTCTSVSVVPAPGSFFGIGTTVVTASTENDEICSFTVTVNAADDNEAPSISCPQDITVDESSSSANSALVTYSVTATDNSGSPTVLCDPPSGSSFAVGTHPVNCTATDASGNTASCTFNVTVNQVGCDLDANSAPPTPNVATLPTITTACTVTLLAANDPTATDACGGTISGETADERTYDTPGTYTVNWTYTDSAGHTATQTQTVIVQPDNSPPVPNAATLPTVTGECSVTLTPPTANDNCDGEILGTMVVPNPITTIGTHTVTWTFTDDVGNSSSQTQTVVVTDTEAPQVTLTGPSSVTVECHASYTDAGATATDNCSPAPTPTSSSNVDVNTPGTYQVIWTATDAGGNTDSETRTVVVVDTTAPVLTLNGASTMTVECHTAFTDPGATAADSCDTSVPVNVAGSVNADAVGTYTLTYTASDDSGNAGTSVSRTVNVVDTTAPAVTLNGAATMAVILGSAFTDPGAAANDSCTGSLAVTVSGSVNTNAVGAYTLTYSATDASNNTGAATRTVNVIYDFTGFFSPVANMPVLNSVNAGRGIPVKFSLNGDQGLNIFAVNNPYSVSLNCNTNDPGVDVTETVTAGGSSLSYSGGQYNYVWKTESSWAGTCRQLVITLNDGTVHTANFKFK